MLPTAVAPFAVAFARSPNALAAIPVAFAFAPTAAAVPAVLSAVLDAPFGLSTPSAIAPVPIAISACCFDVAAVPALLLKVPSCAPPIATELAPAA